MLQQRDGDAALAEQRLDGRDTREWALARSGEGGGRVTQQGRRSNRAGSGRTELPESRVGDGDRKSRVGGPRGGAGSGCPRGSAARGRPPRDARRTTIQRSVSMFQCVREYYCIYVVFIMFYGNIYGL